MDAAAGEDPRVGLTAVVALRQLVEVLEELQVERDASRAGPGGTSPAGWG
jgi:hypothetical protein